MYKNIFLSLLAAVLIVMAGMSVRSASANGGYYFGFEQGTKPFTAHADPAVSTSLDTVLGDSSCNPALYNRYAKLASKPAINLPPGTRQATWIVASFPAAQGEADSVSVSFSAKLDRESINNANCVNCLPVAYAGTQPPQVADFTTLQTSGYMNGNWANYRFETLVVPEMANTIYVAIGWNGTGSAIDLDCVTVTIVPIVQGK